ncbi:MAG: protein kinase [bacterium]
MRPVGLLSQDRNLIELGSYVDHFQVVRLLGRGGMGEVYLARDTKLGRRVAIKVVHRESIGSQEALERFLFEARVTARFNHPHIVTVYAVGELEGSPYVALEYLPGQTLRERMSEGKPGLRESLRFGLAIAEALAEAHRNDIQHRDLKPDNVIIPRDGRLRVLDFGLAKVVTGNLPETGTAETVDIASATLPDVKDAFKTQNKGMRGTPLYMAPEQWQEKPPVAASDIWALGMILYELVAGRHPLRGLPVYGLAIKVGGAEPLPPLEPAEDTPAELTELIGRCLDKNPEERPSAEELTEKLRGLLFGDRVRVSSKRSPFRGLMPFSERDSDFFFGRDEEVAACLERLREEALLPVVGPSGAGKSSFVQAGVIPRLREQGPLRVVKLRPGTQPFLTLATRLLTTERTVSGKSTVQSALEITGEDVAEKTFRDLEFVDSEGLGEAATSLADKLRDAPGLLALVLQRIAEQDGATVLLVVDQLEELYTLVEDGEVRRRFSQAICSAADDPLGPVRAVFTLRDDYLGRLAEAPEAREALSRVTVIRAPGAVALEQILIQPLRAVGFEYEQPELIAEMVAEVQGEPACLPLLQFACSMMWERRDRQRRRIPRAAYEAIGGVAGALAHHADGVLTGFSADQVRQAREILLRLVTPEGTRRVTAREQLLAGLGSEAGDVLERLSQARLILVRKRTTGEGRSGADLELVHESLIARWDRLARWIDEGREEMIFFAEVDQAAELWRKRGRREDEVWHGEALHEALRKLERYSSKVSDTVKRFLAMGEQKEQRNRQRKRLRRVSLTVALVLVTLVSVVVALVMTDQKHELGLQKDRVEEQRKRAQQAHEHARLRWAEAQREGARAALMRGDHLEARAKLRGSLETEDSPLGRALWWRLSREPLLWKHTLGALVYDVTISPDGKRVAAAVQDRSIYLFDRVTRQVSILRGHGDQVLTTVFSPDQKQLAAGTYGGEIWLWSLPRAQATILTDHAGAVWTLAYSPDGKTLASGGNDRIVRLWDATRGGLQRKLVGHKDRVRAVTFSPDGQVVVSGSNDQAVRLWDVASGGLRREILGHRSGVYDVAYTPDGRLLATASYDRTVRLWNPATGALVRELLGHTAGVTSLDFDSTGRHLASGSRDTTVRIWSAATGRLERVLRGHTAGVSGVRFGPGNRALVSGGRDRSIRLWDWTVQGRGSLAAGHRSGVYAVAFSPDGRRVASGSFDKSIRIWDVRSGARTLLLKDHTAGIWHVAFSPDGTLLASGSRDNTVRIWDLTNGAVKRVLHGHRAPVFCVAFTPDGKHIVSGSFDQTIRVWDVGSGAEKQLLAGHSSTVISLAISDDGKQLASAGDGRIIRIWDLATGHLVRQLAGHTGAVNGLAFHPGGKQLASGSSDRSLRLWDLGTGRGRILGSHTGRVYRVDYSPDGKRIATASADGSVRLWPVDGGVPVVVRGHRAEVNSVAFDPRGRYLASGSDDGTVRLWQADTGRPYWRAPLLTHGRAEVITHRGWQSLLDSGAGPAQPAGAPGKGQGSRWRKAVALEGRLAAMDRRDRVLCLWTHQGQLQIWDPLRDRRLHTGAVANVKQLLALPDGCVVRAEGRVRRYNRAGAYRDLFSGASAIAWDGTNLLAAGDRKVVVFDQAGKRLSEHSADVGVTAVLQLRDRLVLGHADGNMDLLPIGAAVRKPSFSFEDVPSSAVVSLVRGPQGTVIAGYANGLVGIWNLANGGRLYQHQLHGPVIHLRRQAGRLYAATELGDFRVLDLSVFHLDYCKLLQQVWQRVKVVWEAGLPVRREPPKNHRCAAK